MEPNLHLIIHNVVGIISAIVAMGLSIFILVSAPRKMANVTFSLMCLSITIFVVSHVIGVNISDPYISRLVLMFNLSIFFIGIFNLHAILCLINKSRQNRLILVILYSFVTFITIFFIFNPDLFLLPSVPKMYFPNYYEPGILNWIRIVFLAGIILSCVIYFLLKARREAKTDLDHKRYLYQLEAQIIGYIFGHIPNFLVYNINIDPVWGMAFVSLFAVPFVYGAVRYGLFNVRVIAQQAFWYSIAVTVIGGLITLFNYFNNWIREFYPNFPAWTTSFGSAILVVAASVIVWRRLRESDLLKYEFITTATHKFRTPLTHIKWATENLEKSQTAEDRMAQIGYIKDANAKLVELTNLLVNVSEAESLGYEYHLERTDVSAVIEESISALSNQFSIKSQKLIKSIEPNLYILGDASRIKFVVQTFVENAIHYTPEEGVITVSANRKDRNIIFSVIDSGIGISKEEFTYLFSKFYRGSQARLADTEGMGIGLYIAKEIITHHKGKIWAESVGVNKGSTFNFSLPADCFLKLQKESRKAFICRFTGEIKQCLKRAGLTSGMPAAEAGMQMKSISRFRRRFTDFTLIFSRAEKLHSALSFLTGII